MFLGVWHAIYLNWLVGFNRTMFRLVDHLRICPLFFQRRISFCFKLNWFLAIRFLCF